MLCEKRDPSPHFVICTQCKPLSARTSPLFVMCHVRNKISSLPFLRLLLIYISHSSVNNIKQAMFRRKKPLYKITVKLRHLAPNGISFLLESKGILLLRIFVFFISVYIERCPLLNSQQVVLKQDLLVMKWWLYSQFMDVRVARYYQNPVKVISARLQTPDHKK